MASKIEMLYKNGVGNAPKWLIPNIQYEVMMGSVAYGVSGESSDMDIYGFCMPRKEDAFPHLRGEILGFGTQKQRFEQYQEHHLQLNGKEYDFTIYSVVKFFDLVMSNNPNMVDSLYVPQRCVLFCTAIGQMVRDNRKMFLHKGSYHKFRGYAYAQLHKIGTKQNSKNAKRQADIEKYGFDTKFAYHVCRLALEAEQILIEGDLDIERNRELLKGIRRGEWTLEYLKEWFQKKEAHLEDLYNKSKLQHSPDEEAIKQLLLDCMEHHYGSLSVAVERPSQEKRIIAELEAILERYR